MAQEESTSPQKENEFAKKWGKPTKEAGWTSVPNMLIYRQRSLDISPLDLNILLHLMSYWWDSDKIPFPSKDTLAESIGVRPGTIRKRIKGMEAAGFLKRIERRRESGRSGTNEYDLSPLREKLIQYAEAELKEKRKASAGKRKRKTSVTKP